LIWINTRGARRRHISHHEDDRPRALVLGSLRRIVVMVPFCRSPEEADRVLAEMACHGLPRGNGLEIFVMCEIPSNVILAERFAQRFDGFSIGSNDLTQLVLGVDRDNATLKALFDARNPAVMEAISTVLAKARASGTKTGICGQAPSDHPSLRVSSSSRGSIRFRSRPTAFSQSNAPSRPQSGR